jgi:hypothetical protein
VLSAQCALSTKTCVKFFDHKMTLRRSVTLHVKQTQRYIDQWALLTEWINLHENTKMCVKFFDHKMTLRRSVTLHVKQTQKYIDQWALLTEWINLLRRRSDTTDLPYVATTINTWPLTVLRSLIINRSWALPSVIVWPSFFGSIRPWDSVTYQVGTIGLLSSSPVVPITKQTLA